MVKQGEALAFSFFSEKQGRKDYRIFLRTYVHVYNPHEFRALRRVRGMRRTYVHVYNPHVWLYVCTQRIAEILTYRDSRHTHFGAGVVRQSSMAIHVLGK